MALAGLLSACTRADPAESCGQDSHVVDSVRELNLTLPIVVRLAGTNVEEGRKIIDQSGLTVISAETLADAAKKAVAAAKNAA